ncbi:hypothetical protein V0M98_17400 [Pseudomonas silesiensis]|uniref:hypothetical protein n=1 Tax=Pseudomonas silesiensis TaxID=1853130 RepID=UPI0030CD779F
MTDKPILESANIIRRLWDKHGSQKKTRLLGFCLSLLPIPIIQQSGQILDRYLSDKESSDELERIWSKLEEINAAVASAETLEAAIAEIAITARENTHFREECERLSSILGAENSEFIVETEDRSYQELISTVIKTSQLSVSATNASVNVIEDSKIFSPRTRLHASGGSKNFVNRSEFSDGQNSISMQGISTRGNVELKGSSIGIGPGSSIGFGLDPNLVSGNCPICRVELTIDARRLVNVQTLQCAACNGVFPFDVS